MTSRAVLQPWRVRVVILMFLGWLLAISGRTAYVQVQEHEQYRLQAADEHWGRLVVPAPRGTIRDASGHPLALTVYSYSVVVENSTALSAADVERIADALAPLLRTRKGEIAATLQTRSAETVALKEALPYDLGLKIASMNLPGVRLIPKAKRTYPEGNLAVHVLGFVGRDERGLMGIEADYNGELAGRPGVVLYERDTTGREIPLGIRRDEPPAQGSDLILTIDRTIQRILERELDAAMQRHQASGGTFIVMDPNTGGILGMASRPAFDLRKLDLTLAGDQMPLFRNRAITDVFEPGSTFKLITMAAALQEGKITPDTTMMDTGVVVKSGWPIRNWNFQANGLSTMTQVLINSANVGAVWVSDLLGPTTFYQYLDLFGFGQPTQIDLGGEVTGVIRRPGTPGWTEADMATNSFGQALSVTPIQMVTAVAAIVNGGSLMRPHIVQEVTSQSGKRDLGPVVVRRVLSERTAAQVREMMISVVERGYTDAAQMKSYHGGGKTGTAQKPGEGGYTEDTIPSFVGFAPAEDPKIVVFVKIDEPKDSPWGAQVAMPAFATVGEQILTYLRVPPTRTATETKTPTPR